MNIWQDYNSVATDVTCTGFLSVFVVVVVVVVVVVLGGGEPDVYAHKHKMCVNS